jgi:DNA-binding MarR family transcriptional regulator
MSPEPLHSPPAAILTQLIVEIFRANGALLTRGDQMTGEIGQSSSRWQVMASVEGERRTVAQIARTMGLTRQSVQRSANLLVKDGLAEFTPNPHHRRAKLLLLTKRGTRTLASITQAQVDWSNEMAEGMTQQDLRAALRVLRRLSSRLVDATGETGRA